MGKRKAKFDVKPKPKAEFVSAVELLGVGTVNLLRRHGFVVVHSKPIHGMMVAAALHLDNDPNPHVEGLWHAMVGCSVRSQKHAHKLRKEADENQRNDS